MKTLIFIASLAISIALVGCSKKSSPTPTTWISGKWKLTVAYNDTVANINRVDDNIYHDVLNFIDDHTVTSVGNNTSFQYSLSTMTLTEGGTIYTIKKLSDTKLDLVNYVGQYRLLEFVKE